MSTQTNSLIPFIYEGNPLNAVKGPDGKPWFCAREVCKILGYKDTSRAVAIHCEEDEGTTKRSTPTRGGNQELLFVSESNLYRLVFGSQLPAAKRFSKWVFTMLIPSAMRAVGVIPQETEPLQSELLSVYRNLAKSSERQIASLEKKVRLANAPRAVTAEEVSLMAYLYQSGAVSIGAIARLTKRSRSTVRRQLTGPAGN